MEEFDSMLSFQTPIFEIQAGDGGAVFHAHAGVLAKSKVLKKSVAGWGSETKDRKLVWKDWDAETIERFLYWLYTGDYVCPNPTISEMKCKDSEHTPASHIKDTSMGDLDVSLGDMPQADIDEDWAAWGSRPLKSKKGRKPFFQTDNNNNELSSKNCSNPLGNLT